MLRIGQTLVSRGVFDEVCFLATYEGGLPREELLSEGQRVVRLGAPPQERNKVAHLLSWMREVYRVGVKMRPACLNIHSLTLLPLGVLMKWRTGARLVYDTHELESKTSAAGPLRQAVYGVAERALMPTVDHTFVVCDSINEWYRTHYGIDTVTTIKNYPSLLQTDDAGIALRERIRAKAGDLVFLYQGRIAGGRGVGILLDAFADARLRADGTMRHVVFMGDGPLRPQVEELSRTCPWVHWVPPVEPAEVLSMTRQADVTLCVGELLSDSYLLSLPNKMLESLAAEVPIVASDWPEMRRELEEGRFGWLIEPDAEALVQAVLAATPAEIALRKEALAGWHATHNWEAQESTMVQRYGALGLS